MSKVNYVLDEVINHMLQLSRFQRIGPDTRFFLKSPISRLSWLKCQIFMNFSSWLQLIFENLMWKSWLLMAKLCVCIPLGKHLVISTIFLLAAKNCLKWVWESIQFVFLTMKSAMEPNRLLLKCLLCHVDIQGKKTF